MHPLASNTLKQIINFTHLVCPTKDNTIVSLIPSGDARFNAQIPLIPGKSIEACSCIPMPFRIILKDPSLYAP